MRHTPPLRKKNFPLGAKKFGSALSWIHSAFAARAVDGPSSAAATNARSSALVFSKKVIEQLLRLRRAAVFAFAEKNS